LYLMLLPNPVSMTSKTKWLGSTNIKINPVMFKKLVSVSLAFLVTLCFH